jgi:hypothetical protein
MRRLLRALRKTADARFTSSNASYPVARIADGKIPLKPLTQSIARSALVAGCFGL